MKQCKMCRNFAVITEPRNGKGFCMALVPVDQNPDWNSFTVLGRSPSAASGGCPHEDTDAENCECFEERK